MSEAGDLKMCRHGLIHCRKCEDERKHIRQERSLVGCDGTAAMSPKDIRIQALSDALKAIDGYPWNDVGRPTGVPTPVEVGVCEANKRAIQRLIDEACK